MKEEDCIAYKGEKFQIEFYFDEKGESQALEYTQDMGDKDKQKLLHLLQWMGDMGEIKNITKFRNEGDGIFAFKPQPHRFLCFFFEGGKIILTNAFWKKQDKLPTGEKRRALKIKEEYEDRIKKEEYYDR
jgi:hypothetical protein